MYIPEWSVCASITGGCDIGHKTLHPTKGLQEKLIGEHTILQVFSAFIYDDEYSLVWTITKVFQLSSRLSSERIACVAGALCSRNITSGDSFTKFNCFLCLMFWGLVCWWLSQNTLCQQRLKPCHGVCIILSDCQVWQKRRLDSNATVCQWPTCVQCLCRDGSFQNSVSGC